jgi:hypothetical protein
MKPSSNTVVSTGGGVFAVVFAWILKEAWGVEMPAEVQVAFGAALSIGAGYIVDLFGKKDVA